MKNLKKFMMLLLAVVLFTSGSCSGDEDFMLPTITQTGENTFGCYIDGKLFYPRDGSGTLGSPSTNHTVSWIGSGDNTYNELEVNNFQDGKPINNFIMHFQTSSENLLGEYIWQKSNFEDGIDSYDHTHLFIRAYDYKEGIFKWYGSLKNSGKTIITRRDGGIVSGTFSGILTEEGGTNTVEITNGRFDINTFTIFDYPFP
ncbi:hypothetical protein JBL43_16210 [Aureibaculum sp. A20]|uniref:Lipoprotein n=1 Tax=Aureibaculum flavum TaxID=2795986 RepID=A0ABS0WUZ1_9FLAO|nr:hypothetical protein [Aureibaculum flavum]MBJ2175799.1 hypothetical protein [Aureibaculum flavum]